MIDGTRFSSRSRPADPSTQRLDRGYSRDLGLSPLVTAAMTFSGSTVAATGKFGAFQPGEIIAVSGTNLNNGQFLVLGSSADALTLEPMPKPETAANCSIRSIINVPPLVPTNGYFLLGGYRMLLGGNPVTW